jgi:hypothetical protein
MTPAMSASSPTVSIQPSGRSVLRGVGRVLDGQHGKHQRDHAERAEQRQGEHAAPAAQLEEVSRDEC